MIWHNIHLMILLHTINFDSRANAICAYIWYAIDIRNIIFISSKQLVVHYLTDTVCLEISLISAQTVPRHALPAVLLSIILATFRFHDFLKMSFFLESSPLFMSLFQSGPRKTLSSVHHFPQTTPPVQPPVQTSPPRHTGNSELLHHAPYFHRPQGHPYHPFFL